jgi:hypothetical protein
MMCCAALERALHMTVSSMAPSAHPNVGGAAATTSRALVPEAFTTTAPPLCAHTWEWSTTCCAPVAASVIALVAALHGGSHDLSVLLDGGHLSGNYRTKEKE